MEFPAGRRDSRGFPIGRETPPHDAAPRQLPPLSACPARHVAAVRIPKPPAPPATARVSRAEAPPWIAFRRNRFLGDEPPAGTPCPLEARRRSASVGTGSANPCR